MISYLNELRIIIADFLNINLVNKSWVFINLWSFIHLFAGMLLIYLIIQFIKIESKTIYSSKIKLKKHIHYFILFTLLVFWEIFEFINYGIIKTPLFLADTSIDIIWDLIIGMLGGFIILKKY
jgi:hypothetical protein